MKRPLLFCIMFGLVMTAVPVGAAVVLVAAVDLPGGDTLTYTVGPLAEELGDPGQPGWPNFPVGEQISYSAVPTTLSAYPLVDSLLISNVMISITNLQAYDFAEVFYVAGGPSGAFPAGWFSNYDGMINGAYAMRIDGPLVGVNNPLYSESMTGDGIFQAGETWQFIVQDYSGVYPAYFDTAGQVGVLDTHPSIIVPEPAGLSLSLLGGLLLLRRRR